MPQIAINIKEGKLQKDDVIVGIDLGTTNSLIAIIDPKTGDPVALRDTENTSIVPSIIHFTPDGQPIVGKDAIPFLIDDPGNTIYSVKRLMGKSYADIGEHGKHFSYKIIDDNTESLVKIQVGDTFYSPITLSSYILAELRARAEKLS